MSDMGRRKVAASWRKGRLARSASGKERVVLSLAAVAVLTAVGLAASVAAAARPISPTHQAPAASASQHPGEDIATEPDMDRMSILGMDHLVPRVWYYTPSPLTPPSGSTTDAARGAASDSWGHVDAPLDGPASAITSVPRDVIGEPAYLGQIPTLPGELAVVGTFASFHAVLSPSHLSIYTVIEISVEQELGAQPGGPSPAAGSTIELLAGCGSIRLPTGRVVNFDLCDPADTVMRLTPGGRFVFFLTYNAKGDYYSLLKWWVLVNGEATSGDGVDIYAEQHGNPGFASIPEAKFLAMVRAAFVGGK